jgi:DNA-binding SARP family transcriptional activator
MTPVIGPSYREELAMAKDVSIWRFRVCLLGSFHLGVHGKPVSDADWKSKKALNLFRYLVARRGERVPKDQLMEVLWPDTDFDTSLEHNLHTCVYFARRVLEPHLERYGKSELITCSNGLYCLERVEGCWVDIEEFEASYLEGKRLQKEDKTRAIDTFNQAIAYYRGDFLAEDPYLDWATEAREYYREIYVDATLRLSALLAESDDKSEAIQICRNALRKDPYREDLHHTVINYLIDAGRYSEAATQYRTYARMMREEFGLEPSREAGALLQRIQQSGQSAVATASEGGTSSSGAFVCERKVFESICRLEHRRQGRSRQPVTFMMVSLGASGGTKGSGHLSTISSSLRQGDVVCQWDERNIAICLWGTDELGAKIVSRRLKGDMGKGSVPQMAINYEVIKSDDGRPLSEILQKTR